MLNFTAEIQYVYVMVLKEMVFKKRRKNCYLEIRVFFSSLIVLRSKGWS